LIIRFFEAINTNGFPQPIKIGFVKFDSNLINIAQFREKPDKWFKTFSISITSEGIVALKEERNRVAQEIVNQSTINANKSAIDVNKSIQDTNISVQNTNKSIIDISEKQAAVNQIIADNSIIQTAILKSQRMILWSTVLVAFLSMIISYSSYRKDIPNEKIEKEVFNITKRLDALQLKLSEIKKDSTISLKGLVKKKQ